MAWDDAENCLNPRLVWLGNALVFARGYTIGQSYFAVKNEMVERTEEIQESHNPQDLTFYEASGMVAYLTETFGADTVFGHWDLDPDSFETVYGKTFSELYHDWTIWNEEQCVLSGILIP